MRRTVFILFLISLSVCGFSQQTVNGLISHDGKQRSYILYIPASYSRDVPVPLVFNFHGYASNANAQMRYGDFRSIADTAGFIVVHPQGILLNGVPHWNVGGWTQGSTADDVGFTEMLIDHIASSYNIDLNRIYSTGMSNGGYMSFLLACQLSDKIAAVASVTGSMTPQIFNNCNPQHPTPVLQIHGTFDNVVPYTGASWTKSIDETLQYWVNYNDCNPTANKTALPNASLLDGSTAEYINYQNGDRQATVEHFKIKGGGHTWPGTVLRAPGTNYDIDASAEIWKFFSRYDLTGLTETPTDIEELNENERFLKIYPNPTPSHITIDWKAPRPINYEVFSTAGKRLLRGFIQNSRQEIDLSSLASSVYFLKINGEVYKILKTE